MAAGIQAEILGGRAGTDRYPRDAPVWRTTQRLERSHLPVLPDRRPAAATFQGTPSREPGVVRVSSRVLGGYMVRGTIFFQSRL